MDIIGKDESNLKGWFEVMKEYGLAKIIEVKEIPSTEEIEVSVG